MTLGSNCAVMDGNLATNAMARQGIHRMNPNKDANILQTSSSTQSFKHWCLGSSRHVAAAAIGREAVASVMIEFNMQNKQTSNQFHEYSKGTYR